MTFRVKKRGKAYRLRGRSGDRLRRGTGERERIRLSLGTANGDAAQLLHGKIERALSEGPSSSLWRELRNTLPSDTFSKLSTIIGYEPSKSPEVFPWSQLESKFTAWMSHRVALDKLQSSTCERHLQNAASFGSFLVLRGISDLSLMSRPVIEDFKVWRLARVLEKKHSRAGRGVVLDVAILRRIFGFAVECEMIAKNPVRLEGRPGDEPARGAQPFKAAELVKLRAAADVDLFAFLLLR